MKRQMIVGEIKMMVCRLRFAPRIVTPVHEHPHEQITIVEKVRVLFIFGDKERNCTGRRRVTFPIQ